MRDLLESKLNRISRNLEEESSKFTEYTYRKFIDKYGDDNFVSAYRDMIPLRNTDLDFQVLLLNDVVDKLGKPNEKIGKDRYFWFFKLDSDGYDCCVSTLKVPNQYITDAKTKEPIDPKDVYVRMNIRLENAMSNDSKGLSSIVDILNKLIKKDLVFKVNNDIRK